MKKHTATPYVLYLTVFITGAAVLVIEVTATRLLSPHFGMTLFTVSSILAVILAALSLGYWLGGKLADRYPEPVTLYTAISIAGVTTLFIHILNTRVLPTWSAQLDLISGPLVTSLILFFIPTIFLGMVSPIAIRLSTSKLKEVGEVAGKVFFFSTVGSIAGSLLAGFVLIPRFPISRIILGTSLVLIVLGLFGVRKKMKAKNWLTLFIATIALQVLALKLQPPTRNEVIHEEDSMYQHIRVVKQEFAEGEGLVLMLDKSYSGASYLQSDELPFPYTRYYKLYELVNKNAKRFLYLGGGAYTTPKKLLSERKDAIEVEVVEIDPKLPEIARKFFGLRDDPRQTLIIADARTYLKKSQKRYDMIFIDVFSMDIGIPSHLMTQEFFQLVKNHLTDKGTVIMNVAANIDNSTPSLGLSAIKTFREVFPQSEFIALRPSDLPSIQNIMFWGINDASWKFDDQDPRIANAESKEIRSVANNRIDLSQFDTTNYKLLTDDYAPIEYLVAKMIRDASQ
ncbi:fused MFS/spermidine synthase [Patescibacteria group bacterium]|nr:fused MFS/spermidine synthase [Patescibacteria group bacterium]